MKKVLFVGEGKLDIGTEGRNGPITILFRRVVDGSDWSDFGAQVEYWTGITGQQRKLPHLHMRRRRDLGLSTGYQPKVLFLLLTTAGTVDGIVCVFDRDIDHGYRLSDARNGRDEARKRGIQTPCALGMPIETAEAWLIADRTCVAKILGCDHERLSRLPELSRSPKEELTALVPPRRDTLDIYVQIAENMNLAELRRLCPVAFPAFESEIRVQFRIAGGPPAAP